MNRDNPRRRRFKKRVVPKPYRLSIRNVRDVEMLQADLGGAETYISRLKWAPTNGATCVLMNLIVTIRTLISIYGSFPADSVFESSDGRRSSLKSVGYALEDAVDNVLRRKIEREDPTPDALWRLHDTLSNFQWE